MVDEVDLRQESRPVSKNGSTGNMCALYVPLVVDGDDNSHDPPDGYSVPTYCTEPLPLFLELKKILNYHDNQSSCR